MNHIQRLLTIATALIALMSGIPTVSAQGSGYKLPYPAGKTYLVTQAWTSGPRPHKSQFGTTNAVDFGMPEESLIVAARGGWVKAVVQGNSACGGATKANNYIIIAHDGDTLEDWYVHISQNSALVAKGSRVSQGQPIAKSGKVGYTSCAPHLHFHVQDARGNRKYIRFDDVGDIVGGRSYTSGNGAATPGVLTRSRLYVDPANKYLKLAFCGKNIHQTMAVKSWRAGRSFGVQWIRVDFGSSEGCVTVENLADGKVLRTPTTYYSAVAFNDRDVGNVCHSTRGLCDSLRSPGW